MIPENGARICIFASFASASCSAASATRRLFSASSFACDEMKLLLARSTARSYLLRASVRFARACCTSASGTAVSSCTSSEPLATRWPSWKPIVLMRPATSGRSVTDSSERRLPTAVIVCGMDTVATLTASTVTLPPPPGPPCPPGPPLPAAGGDDAPPGAGRLCGHAGALRAVPVAATDRCGDDDHGKHTCNQLVHQDEDRSIGVGAARCKGRAARDASPAGGITNRRNPRALAASRQASGKRELCAVAHPDGKRGARRAPWRSRRHRRQSAPPPGSSPRRHHRHAPHPRHAHPPRNATPPTGVTAPNPRTPVNASA